MAGESTRGLTSWLHHPGARLEELSAKSSAQSSSAAATTSPVDITLAVLRATEAISRISPDKRALVEEIDVEEDDAEFDEKAHWGRRSAVAHRKKTKRTAGRGKASVPPNYSIKAFCVPQDGIASARSVETERETDACESESDVKATAANAFIADDPDYVAESTEHSEEVGVEGDHGRQDDEGEEEDEAMESHDSSESEQEEEEEEEDEEEKVTQPAPLEVPTLSSRPKRQAVLRTQEAQQLAKQQALALESVLSDKKKKKKKNAVVVEAFMDLQSPPLAASSRQKTKTKTPSSTKRPSSQPLELTSTPSVGRKRKLEMDTKRTPSPAKAATGAAFFLSEIDKKQLQELEAVAKLREQLRTTREKDLAFFSGKTAVNPFFQALAKPPPPLLKPSTSSSDEATDTVDTDEYSGSAGLTGRLRWAKDAALFPAVQHVLCADVDASEEQLGGVTSSTSLRLRLWPKKKKTEAIEATSETANNTADTAVLLVDDSDNDDSDDESRRFTTSAASMEQQVRTELSFSDVFWFQQYNETSAAKATAETNATATGDDDASLRFPLEFASESALVDALVDAYGVREKRVRELLDSLVAAREKRRDKAANLTLVDRYTPVRASGVVGNKEALRLLASWLGAWKRGGGERDRQSCFQAELFVFEGDDSDSDELSDLCRIFVLEGESGAGKSAAVYACAEELGYNVLEINAGQSRAGRNIVEIVGEATQSTRVLHASHHAPGTNKPTAKKLKPKKQKRGRTSVDSSAAHLSLVLFEDVRASVAPRCPWLSLSPSLSRHSPFGLLLYADDDGTLGGPRVCRRQGLPRSALLDRQALQVPDCAHVSRTPGRFPSSATAAEPAACAPERPRVQRVAAACRVLGSAPALACARGHARVLPPVRRAPSAPLPPDVRATACD